MQIYVSRVQIKSVNLRVYLLVKSHNLIISEEEEKNYIRYE